MADTRGLDYSGLCGVGSVPLHDGTTAVDTTTLDYSGLGLVLVKVTAAPTNVLPLLQGPNLGKVLMRGAHI